MIIYLNGDYIPIAEARISPLDRGFLFGDAVYEVIKSQDGKLFYYEPHINRLRNSLAGIRLEFNAYDELTEAFSQLLTTNQLNRGTAMVYLQISRGSYQERSHEFPKQPIKPTVLAMALNAPPAAMPLKLISHPEQRWAYTCFKTTSLLPNVLAKQQAVEQQAQEVVFVRDNIVIECSSSALIRVSDGVVYTHPPADYILPSITIQVAKDLCHSEGIEWREEPFTLQEAYEADELMVLSTTKDISPGISLDGKQIGDGKPGTVTKRLIDAFNKLLMKG